MQSFDRHFGARPCWSVYSAVFNPLVWLFVILSSSWPTLTQKLDLGIRPKGRPSPPSPSLGRAGSGPGSRSFGSPTGFIGWRRGVRNDYLFSMGAFSLFKRWSAYQKSRVILDNCYTTPAEQQFMGACPYCRSATLPGDTICYSCGRVLPKGDRGSYRLEQQFSKRKGAKETTYMMAAKPSQRGVVQTHTGRQRNIMKRRKNRFRSLAMLGLVAFVMLSPQAQEAVFGEFGGVEEFLQSQLAPYHVYPNEASYTLSKIADVSKGSGEGAVTENILIPPTVRSSISGAAQFAFTDGTNQTEPLVLQQTLQITLAIDGQDINVPIDGMPDRNIDNAIVTSSGHQVWWPAIGSGDDECPLQNA